MFGNLAHLDFGVKCSYKPAHSAVSRNHFGDHYKTGANLVIHRITKSHYRVTRWLTLAHEKCLAPDLKCSRSCQRQHQLSQLFRKADFL